MALDWNTNITMFVALAILLLSAEDLNANDCGQELCHPARISPHKTTVLKGDPLQITCSIEIPDKSGQFGMYLCKDGQGIQMTSMNYGSNFTVETHNSDASGYYSCVYSTIKMVNPQCHSKPAADSVLITVSGQELCHPARISPDKTRVLKGDPLQISCSIENPAHKSGQFSMYLCKNGLGIKISPTKDGRHFTVETSSSDVSGSYSCVYSIVKMANPQCHSEPAADSIYITVYDPAAPQETSSSSGILAAVTVIFLMVLAALLGYQHRDRLKRLIWSARGRQRQGGTQDHIPAEETEQQHQDMATYQEVGEYSAISYRQGQTRASAVSSATDTVYSTVEYQDQVAEDVTYGKVNKKGKTKKPKEVTDALASLP